MKDLLEAGFGHLPTMLRLAALLKGCESTFSSVDPLVAGLARTADPEAAVLAVLPVLATIPKATCRAARVLTQSVPSTGKPSTFVALGKAFETGDLDDGDPKPKSFLWTAAEKRKSGEVRWAATAEAAMYLIGGAQAEKRAAVMRKYK